MPSLVRILPEAQITLPLHGNATMSSTTTTPEVIEIDSDSDSDNSTNTVALQRQPTRSPRNADTPRLRMNVEPPRQQPAGEPNHHQNGFGLLEDGDGNPDERDLFAHALGLIREQHNERRFPGMQPYPNHRLAQNQPNQANHHPRQFPYPDQLPAPLAGNPPATLQDNINPDIPDPRDFDFYFAGNEDLQTPFRFGSPVDLTMQPTRPQEPAAPPVEFDIVLQQVVEIFPDICPNYVREIYDDRVALTPTADDLGERVILQIVEKGEKYPRKKVNRKRKSEMGSGDEDEDEEQVAQLLRKDREAPTARDIIDARSVLGHDFPTIPYRFIAEQLKEHKHLYPAYRAVVQAQRAREDTNKSTYDPLKKRRTNSLNPPTIVSASMKKEYELIKKRMAKEDDIRARKKRDAEEDAALDKKAFDEGDIKECECCFTESPFRKMVHCDGDNPHFFCIECMAGHIKAQLDYQKYKILCMDGQGCKAEFSRAAKMKCLDKDMFNRLERVQQQAELRDAKLPGLETCPFCDFAAICPPVNEDKEFRCEHPDCKLTSCRLCRNKSHLPKTCEENKKEHGIEERHIVEEEMTKALIRPCPKCKVPILKTEGCNKIVCSQCGAYICDVCAKDITKDGYNHFGPGKCAQYDYGSTGAMTREKIRVQEAEKAAKAKVRAENPDISDADLEIKFSDAIKKREGRFGVPGNDPAERIAAYEGMIHGGGYNFQERADHLRGLQGRLDRVNELLGENAAVFNHDRPRDMGFVQGFNVAFDQARNMHRVAQDNRRPDFDLGRPPQAVRRRRTGDGNMRVTDPPPQPQERRDEFQRRYNMLNEDLNRRMQDREDLNRRIIQDREDLNRRLVQDRERRNRVRPWLDNVPGQPDRHHDMGFGGGAPDFGMNFPAGPFGGRDAAAAGMQYGAMGPEAQLYPGAGIFGEPRFGQDALFPPAAQVFLPRDDDPSDRIQGGHGREGRHRRNRADLRFF